MFSDEVALLLDQRDLGNEEEDFLVSVAFLCCNPFDEQCANEGFAAAGVAEAELSRSFRSTRSKQAHLAAMIFPF